MNESAPSGRRDRLPRAPRRGGGLYVHVPFCARICGYCHFPRTDRHDPALRRRTVAAIIRELALRRDRCTSLRGGGRRLESAYFGGGTPSVLEAPLFAELVAGTLGSLPSAADLEVTAEANPESFTAETATTWRDAGVNRISLGVQSLSAPALRWLGRIGDPDTARAALARACGAFPRVAADWILAPGVTAAGLGAELAEAVALGVEHISLYLLEVHPGTPLARAVGAGDVRLRGGAHWERLYLDAVARLEELGLRQYEVASFARPGCESRHNTGYWRGRPYLGLGPGAHGFWGRRRYANTADIAAYVAGVEGGALPPGTVDPLDRAARRLESLILPLRTTRGVPLRRLPVGALDLERGEAAGLWRRAGGHLRLTPRGFLRLDTIEAALADAVAAPRGRRADRRRDSST